MTMLPIFCHAADLDTTTKKYLAEFLTYTLYIEVLKICRFFRTPLPLCYCYYMGDMLDLYFPLLYNTVKLIIYDN